MIVELISTGSELLLGDTVNTNVSWLAQELNKLGYTIAHQSVVGDNPKRMAEVFQLASSRADIVISTGGLGPTQGDITRNVLADSVGRKIIFNQEAMDEVERFFQRVNVLCLMQVVEKHIARRCKGTYIIQWVLRQVLSLKMEILHIFFCQDLLVK